MFILSYAVLKHETAAYLMQLYSIPRFKDKDVMSFLAQVAKATGKLKKGGKESKSLSH
jgi:hypothetical protein